MLELQDLLKQNFKISKEQRHVCQFINVMERCIDTPIRVADLLFSLSYYNNGSLVLKQLKDASTKEDQKRIKGIIFP